MLEYRDRAPFGAQTCAWQPICNASAMYNKMKSSSTYIAIPALVAIVGAPTEPPPRGTVPGEGWSEIHTK